MTPKSFDIQTCSEMIGDDRQRYINRLVDEDIESGHIRGWPVDESKSYWSQASQEFERITYMSAYRNKLERMARIDVDFDPSKEFVLTVKSVVDKNDKALQEYKSGKEKALGAIIGQVKKLVNAANPLEIKFIIDTMIL
jgi:hypothetical protein